MPLPRRALLLGIAAALAVVAVVVGGAVTAGRTLFGPEAFVQSYVEALQRGNVAGALSLAGAAPTGADGDDLLRADALAPFEVKGIRDLGADEEDGSHAIEVSWTAAGEARTTTLAVVQDGSRGLLFPRWAFAEPPVAVLELSARGDDRVDVNGVRLQLPDRSRFAVLVPGVYGVGHESPYLVAEQTAIVATVPGSELRAQVEAQPSERLVADAAAAATRFLDACAEQTVLFPTGCPFGREVDDRVTETPAWSIAEYPELALDAASAGWLAEGEGVAHLRVRVQEIFDGSRRWVEEDIRFRLRLDIQIAPGDRLVIVPDDRLSIVR